MNDKLVTNLWDLQKESFAILKRESRIHEMERNVRLRKVLGTYDDYYREYDFISSHVKYLDFNQIPMFFPFKRVW